jgi:hypothetical protein
MLAIQKENHPQLVNPNLSWIHVPQLTYTVAVAVGMDIESLTVISWLSY